MVRKVFLADEGAGLPLIIVCAETGWGGYVLFVVTENRCVLCVVGTEFLNACVQINFRRHRFCTRTNTKAFRLCVALLCKLNSFDKCFADFQTW